ncbi:amidase signature enzyme [Obba rivulosa]|uniref:Amidase signature enzyme n=1 Tax=Obba rivulosa TaxID=1052685 RepID=A0A8E2AXX6_9APHY|nr:amidase signature enzyme [Obba rivulosa]
MSAVGSLQTENPDLPDLYEASIAELQDGLTEGLFTSVDLVKAYLARIEEVNLQGPMLRAVIETNPKALEQAAILDSERKQSGSRGLLHGIPILVKDNIATLHSEGMNTTAGSYALLGSIVPRDATVAAKLRAAGAVILGKSSLSEWANWRGKVPSGFCGRGKQCLSPYVPLGNPSGSSSGSGIAAAIGLAAGTLGSETDGSILSPSYTNNIVGIKPTVGLTSRAGVIPISESQDSVGPMCRCVADAAAVLSVIAGRDPLDGHTTAAPEPVPNYTTALQKDGLHGAIFAVPPYQNQDEAVVKAFSEALDTLRAMGATVLEPADFPDFDRPTSFKNEYHVLETEFKVGIEKYIAGLLEVPTGVRTLADLIKFNIEHADKELVEPYWTDQSIFIKSNERSVDDAYRAALAAGKETGMRYIDGALDGYQADALVMPTSISSHAAAICGYPVITVPLGFLPADRPMPAAEPTRMKGPNEPFGIAFVGTAFSEFNLVKFAYAYEQATQARLKMRAYPEAVPKTQLRDVMAKGM